MNDYEVSVIVPFYNAENTLKDCINSILKQRKIKYEVILIDDGSTDGSVVICDSYANEYTNVKVIHQDNNGVSMARNRGLCEANGKYIAFVDSDDIIEEDYLMELVNAIVKDHTEMVISGYKLISEKCRKEIRFERHEVYNFETFSTFKELSSKMMLATPWAKLFIREKILEVFRTDLALGEDVCFVLTYMKGINSLSILDNSSYHYQIFMNQNSLSKRYHKNLVQVVYAVDDSKRSLFQEKYFNDVEASAFRKESLVSDILLMISKVLKTGTSMRDTYKIIGELIGYLEQEYDLKTIHNKKLFIIIFCYKFKLLFVLKAVYRIKIRTIKNLKD